MDQSGVECIKSYSSSVGKNVMHVCFKAKYCHKVFDDERVRKRCEEIFQETAGRYGMEIRELGFDHDHVHLTVNAGEPLPGEHGQGVEGKLGVQAPARIPVPQAQVLLGERTLEPAYYFDSVGERTSEEIDEYVRKQGKREKKVDAKQWKLADFLD